MAAMPDPPPPYTLNANEELLSPACSRKISLFRYLLDILAFTYDADVDALYDALSSTSLASRHAREPGIVSILSSHERNNLLELSKIVVNARSRVFWQEMAHVSRQSWDLMYRDIVLPFISLNVPTAVALDRIAFYLDHRNNPSKRNKLMFYFKPFNWRKPSTWFKPSTSAGYYSSNLVRDLISDELLCHALAPNDTTRLIITSAIAAVRNKYAPPQSHLASIPTRSYGTLLSSQLLQQINKNADRAAINTENHFQRRTASELLPQVDQLWNILCANRGYSARIPNGPPTTYEVLRRNVEADGTVQLSVADVPR